MAALRLLLVAALLALPLWVGHSGPAHACTGSGPTIEEAVRSADLIAIGTVGEILVLPPESVAHPETLAPGGLPVEMKFQVNEYLKGSAPNPALIYSPAFRIAYNSARISSFFDNGTDCGDQYMSGSSYVLFLMKDDPVRYGLTGRFGGSLAYSDGSYVTDQIAQIRAAVTAEQAGLPPTGSGPAHRSAPLVPLVAASALACIGLAANAAFVLRRRSG
jgi:hypothetical protein